jgi:endoglucanase
MLAIFAPEGDTIVRSTLARRGLLLLSLGSALIFGACSSTSNGDRGTGGATTLVLDSGSSGSGGAGPGSGGVLGNDGAAEAGNDAATSSGGSVQGSGGHPEAGPDTGPDTGAHPEAGPDTGGRTDAGAGPDTGGRTDAGGDARVDGGAAIAVAGTFRCGNWADQRDNFVNGNLLLSGTATTDSYATVLSNSDQILATFQTTIGANTVRVPINEPTVMGTWWATYKASIDAGLARGMRVIVAYWAWHNGRMDDVNVFNTMWDTVVSAYAGNNLVYFQIFNEPYDYQPPEFITLAAGWLARYPNVPPGRVIVAGNYTDQDVRQQGADARLNGTLLSLHIYPFSDATQTSTQGWRDMLQTNLGSYASRTIVSEWGAPMTAGADYSGPGDGDHNASFITALSTYLHDNGIGSCYWPVLRTADPWSLTTLAGTATNPTLTVTNASGLTRVQAAFGLP